jgi:hypothetical protein
MEEKKRSVRIKRPPLFETFDVPTREELLAVKVGDFVKVIFESLRGGCERMWVKLTKCDPGELWEGTLANDPVIVPLKHGDVVSFHPYDSISIQGQKTAN